MKKFLVAAIFGVAGLAAFAGTCTFTKVSFTTIGTHDTAAGQIDNGSGVNILEHKFKVAFLDSSNNVVEVHTIDGCLRSLQDGKSDFYSIQADASSSTTTIALARLANFSEDTSFKVGTTANGDLTLSNKATRTGAVLHVTGKIINNDSDTLISPVACIVVRDSDGNVVVTAKNTSVGDLATGANGTFVEDITVPNSTTTVKSVDVWVDGLDGSSSAAPINPQSDLDNVVSNCGTATSTPVNTSTATPTATITATATNTTTATATNTTAPTGTSTPCGG